MAALSIDKKTAIVGALVEGASIRSVERMTGVHRDTITKLVVRMGKACDRLADDHIRNVQCEQLQLDEVWSFVGKKRNHVRYTDDPRKVGDFWTWVAIDPDSKLVPASMSGSARRRMLTLSWLGSLAACRDARRSAPIGFTPTAARSSWLGAFAKMMVGTARTGAAW